MDGDIFGASPARVGVVLAFYWVKITMALDRAQDGPPLARSGPFHNAHSTTAGKSCRVKRRGAGLASLMCPSKLSLANHSVLSDAL